MTSSWTLGQLVSVEPRTWAGINRPGGAGKIIKIHYTSESFVESVDVKYILGGVDTQLDLDFVSPHEELKRQGRSRRGRDLYRASPAKAAKRVARSSSANAKKNKTKETTIISEQGHESDVKNSPIDAPSDERNAPPPVVLTAVKPKVRSVPISTIAFSSANPDVSPLPDTPKEMSNARRKKLAAKKATSRKALELNSKTPAAAVKEGTKNPKMKRDRTSQPLREGKATTVATKGKAKPKQLLHQSKTSSTLKATSRLSKDLKTHSLPPRKENPGGKAKSTGLASSATHERVPLQDVYKNHLDRASDFVNDIVGPHEDTAPKRRPVTKLAPTPAPVSVESRRQDVFTSVFSEVLTSQQGSLEIADVLPIVNGRASSALSKLPVATPFTQTEMDSWLVSLTQQDRVMVSDGVVYSVF